MATGTDLLYDNPFEYAKILQWQFFEQYSHEPFVAVARFIAKYLGLPDERREEYESKQERGRRALKIMEHQLQQTVYLAGNKLSTADISLYGYTHVAEVDGLNFKKYPAIQKWIERIQSEPRYIGMN